VVWGGRQGGGKLDKREKKKSIPQVFVSRCVNLTTLIGIIEKKNGRAGKERSKEDTGKKRGREDGVAPGEGHETVHEQASRKHGPMVRIP